MTEAAGVWEKIEESLCVKICFKSSAEGNILRSSFRHEDNKSIYQNWVIQYNSDNKVKRVLVG